MTGHKKYVLSAVLLVIYTKIPPKTFIYSTQTKDIPA